MVRFLRAGCPRSREDGRLPALTRSIRSDEQLPRSRSAARLNRPPPKAPVSGRRQLVVATVTLAVASFSHGLTMPLLSLVLDHQGVDETLIGLNAGAYFIAVFAAAPLASRVLRARGPRPA